MDAELPSRTSTRRAYAPSDRGLIHYRYAGPESGRSPLMLLHPFPSSSEVYETFMLEMGRDRTVIAPDLPGYGMSDALGTMVYGENEGEVFLGRSVTKTTHMSEQTMQMVDAEVRRIIDSQYGLARRLIEENSDKMHAMAKALLEWETIETEQIDDIMAGRPPRPPKDFTPRTPPSGGGDGGNPAVNPNPTPSAA